MACRFILRVLEFFHASSSERVTFSRCLPERSGASGASAANPAQSKDHYSLECRPRHCSLLPVQKSHTLRSGAVEGPLLPKQSSSGHACLDALAPTFVSPNWCSAPDFAPFPHEVSTCYPVTKVINPSFPPLPRDINALSC